MTWSGDLARAKANLERRNRDLFTRVALHAHRAMQSGSDVTGSPGQPVDTGNLRNSMQIQFEGPAQALISSNVDYAAAIEDGIGPHGRMTLRSAVGGFHSRKLIIAGFDRLVAFELAQMNGNGP